jgi:predicted metal-dependent enzyme (double-stranded beta helix superfamily)
VAARLAAAVHWPDGDAVTERSWRLLIRARDFDAWLIAWPAGGSVDLHDHGVSAGAISVVSGSLVEAVPERDDTGILRLARHDLCAGATIGFAAGHVHDVTNESGLWALSVHVYRPALTSMTFYELAADRLWSRVVRWAPDGAGDDGRVEDDTWWSSWRRVVAG